MNKIVTALDRHVEVRQSVADIGFGVAVVVLNLFLMLVGVRKYISPGTNATLGISARTFPSFVFIAAIGLGILLILQGFGQKAKNDPGEKIVSFHLISLAILLTIIVFVFTIKPLGYPIANFIMMIIMYWLSGGKSWIKCLVLSIIFTICSVLFFYTYLKLSIPMGLLSWLIK